MPSRRASGPLSSSPLRLSMASPPAPACLASSVSASIALRESFAPSSTRMPRTLPPPLNAASNA